jgi:hypothetical protein
MICLRFGGFKPFNAPRTTLLLVCLVIFGCGEKVGSVSGKVTFRDKPIPVGTVTFFGQKNRVVFAELEEDGSYIVENIPVGHADITVETPNVQPYIPGQGQPAPPPGVLSPAYTRPNIRIPDHYVDRALSGLAHDVQEGPQALDIVLVPDETKKSADQ